jgi:isoleucyl-tRNA synthetase
VVDLGRKKISKSGTYEKPTAADHFVGKYGADLLRLWASSIDYTTDVPFSEEIFTRLGGHVSPHSQHAPDFAWESV